MRTRLTRYARSRAGALLGLTGTLLVAASDRLFGIPTDAVQHREVWPD